MKVLSVLSQHTSNRSEPNYADIFVVMGQSNAVGQFVEGETMTDLPAGYADPQPLIQVLWEGDHDTPISPGEFQAMDIPNNTRNKIYTNPANQFYDETAWGPEQSLMHAAQTRLNKPVYLIKSAVGALAIGSWSFPSGPMFVEVKRMCQDAEAYLLSVGRTPRYRAALWLQGESDSGSTQAYYTNAIRNLIEDIREISDYTADIPFIMYKIKPGTALYNDGVNAAFDTMVTEDPDRNFTIHPNNVPGWGYLADNLHFDNETKLLAGTAAYDLLVAEGLL